MMDFKMNAVMVRQHIFIIFNTFWF